jgi:acetolactate synthase-1/2/3 large subunit
MKMNGAEIACRLLERQGIRIAAGIPGGSCLPLYDALRKSRIRHILARHEQAAGFIAQGMARVTGKAAVCLATSGPGATNLVTAIADAYMDSIPLVALTGQVPMSLKGTRAFQEVDTIGITKPITKQNFQAKSPEEILEIIPLAFQLAESGRPGPVLIDLPKDVQIRTAEFDALPEPWIPSEPDPCPDSLIQRCAEMIQKAERPVLYIGGGIIASGASDFLRIFAEQISAPVASTLMGLGAMPADHPLFIGMLGMHGASYTNQIMEEADLVVAMGVRFDDRATGKASGFCANAGIIHIDIDPSEIGKIKKCDLAVMGDARQALHQLLNCIEPQERLCWTGRIIELKDACPRETPSDPFHPLSLIRLLGELLPLEAIITTDVGQHQMWTAQAYPFRRPRSFLSSGGLGTMGFGLPAAIGASLASPGTKVVCISGDGSFLMNIQDLATLAELDLPVTILIMNNGQLGMVRQQQELFYGARYLASHFERQTNFTAIARGFGIKAFDLERKCDPEEILTQTLEYGGPCVINVPVEGTENVWPIVPPGASNREMMTGTTTMSICG